MRDDPGAWSRSSRRGVVACAHYLAADAGAEVLAAGGNAADAAVATALALNVVEPAASGLGGMAMALVHGIGRAGRAAMLDGACTAPRTATPRLVAESHRYRGTRAIAVPGAPALWHAMHARYGRLPLRELVRPAIELARRGVPFTPLQAELATTYRTALLAGDAPHLGLDGSGAPHPIGSEIRHPELAATLETIGERGLMDCYRGEIASVMAKDLAARGAFVTADDLAAVVPPEPREPLRMPFGHGSLVTAGPPAGGLALAQLIGVVDVLGRVPDLNDPEDLLLVVRLLRRVRADRRRWRLHIGARDLGSAVALLADPALEDVAAAPESDLDDRGGETTHLCVMDADGGTVSMTMSIERSFGSACMTPTLGFLYNGYLRGFKVRARRHPHYLRPGAPARSNAAPTLVFGPDERGPAQVAVGSTGSERMVSGIFTTLLRLERETPFAAVQGARVHCTPEHQVMAEVDRFAPGCVARLRERFVVEDTGPWSFRFGGLQLAVRDGDIMTGVGEPRRDGSAACPEDVR